MSRQRPTPRKHRNAPGKMPSGAHRMSYGANQVNYSNKDRAFYSNMSEDDFEEEFMKKALMRTILCYAVLTVFSILLFFLRFQPPLLPKMFAIELSALPEMFAAIAYGPLAGFAICLIKSAVHVIITPENLITDASAFVVEAVFIVFVGLFYSFRVFPKKPKPDRVVSPFYREKTILLGGLCGTLIALPVQFLSTNFFVFPMLEKLYADKNVNAQAIVESYNVSLAALRAHLPDTIGSFVPVITEVWQGIALVNLPVMAFKMLFVTALTALIYPFVSPFLHYRDVQL